MSGGTILRRGENAWRNRSTSVIPIRIRIDPVHPFPLDRQLLPRYTGCWPFATNVPRGNIDAFVLSSCALPKSFFFSFLFLLATCLGDEPLKQPHYVQCQQICGLFRCLDVASLENQMLLGEHACELSYFALTFFHISYMYIRYKP